MAVKFFHMTRLKSDGRNSSWDISYFSWSPAELRKSNFFATGNSLMCPFRMNCCILMLALAHWHILSTQRDKAIAASYNSLNRAHSHPRKQAIHVLPKVIVYPYRTYRS